jgi:hypothetical protein
MVTYTAKKKRDLIIAGGVLTGVGVAYAGGFTIAIPGSNGSLIGLQLALNPTFNIGGSGSSGGINVNFFSIPSYATLIPGIVTLSLGLAAKKK